MLVLAGGLILAATAFGIVVAHHVAYFRRLRAPTFGAFLETAGWLILLLVAVGILGGGLLDSGTLRVEAASAAVGLLCVMAGWRLRSRMVPRG